MLQAKMKLARMSATSLGEWCREQAAGKSILVDFYRT
jgi:hypothetical protein